MSRVDENDLGEGDTGNFLAQVKNFLELSALRNWRALF